MNFTKYLQNITRNYWHAVSVISGAIAGVLGGFVTALRGTPPSYGQAMMASIGFCLAFFCIVAGMKAYPALGTERGDAFVNTILVSIALNISAQLLLYYW
jgi:F0F1-type ATP synthase assembly protein I